MTADSIRLKYMRHLRYANGAYVGLDAVELALSLALEELAESIPSTPSISSTTDQRQAERTAAQLELLNDWLAKHEPAAYTAPGDTATAVLSVLASYRSALAQQSTISNQQSSIDNPPFVPPNPSPAPLSLDLSSLAPDELQQVAAVQSGAKTWRTVPKELRQKVAHLTLCQLAARKGSRLQTDEWDIWRPPWMPTAGAIALMFGAKWTELPQE